MAKKKQEKIEERIYNIPLRRAFLKVPKYKRAKKAVKTIKEFVVRHMKVRDRDLNKVKIGDWVNKAVWIRGIKNPPQKITVKVSKEGDNIIVSFVGLPKKFKSEDQRLRKKKEKTLKKKEEARKKAEAKKKEEEAKKAAEADQKKLEEKTEEEIKKEEEKKKKDKELRKQTQKQEKSTIKTTTKKQVQTHRKVLKK